jgi:hypothetical protein
MAVPFPSNLYNYTEAEIRKGLTYEKAGRPSAALPFMSCPFLSKLMLDVWNEGHEPSSLDSLSKVSLSAGS